MYIPAVGMSGLAGWKVLERTQQVQFRAYAGQESIQRDVGYFRSVISDVAEPGDLLEDRRLMSVVLTAYGLEDEIDKRAIIRRVMEDGVTDPKAFANRMNDPRWKAFAKDFDFSLGLAPPAALSSIQDRIVESFKQRGFERAVGEADPNMRLALNFKREIKLIADSANVERIGWLQVMAQKPLRAVIERALDLPASVGTLDLDRQRAVFADRAEKAFGGASPIVFRDEANVDAALRRFFASAERESGPNASTPGHAALSLLTASLGLSNLFDPTSQ
ncbi:MAG: DUF1217 domain-containing protein [Parvularculaceae bacterium]